jgi:hypothetical protein
LKIAGEAIDGLECLRAYVVFHAFDIVLDNVWGDSEKCEKPLEQIVATGDLAGNAQAAGSQNEAPVFFVFDEALGIETLLMGYVGKTAAAYDYSAPCSGA